MNDKPQIKLSETVVLIDAAFLELCNYRYERIL